MNVDKTLHLNFEELFKHPAYKQYYEAKREVFEVILNDPQCQKEYVEMLIDSIISIADSYDELHSNDFSYNVKKAVRRHLNEQD